MGVGNVAKILSFVALIFVSIPSVATGQAESAPFNVAIGSEGEHVRPNDPIGRFLTVLGLPAETEEPVSEVPFRATLYRYPGISFVVADDTRKSVKHRVKALAQRLRQSRNRSDGNRSIAILKAEAHEHGPVHG